MNLTFSSEDRVFFKRSENFILKSILFFILSFSTPLFLYANGSDTITVQKSQDALIYVGSDITIQGSAYIYNGDLIESASKILSKGKDELQTKANSPSSTIASSKKNILKDTIREEKLKKLQQEISERFQNCHYSGSQDIENNQRTITLFVASAASNILRTSDSAKTVCLTNHFLNAFDTQLEKQIFHTTISHLQNCKLKNSFLRGPPSIA